LQTIVLRKYAYANDLAIKTAHQDWQALKGVQRTDIATTGKYLYIPPYMEVKAQHYKNNVSSLLSQQGH